MPIRFIVMMRRLMYYWHVLHKDEDELLHRFMSAQQIWTGRTDWITQVRKNMTDIELNLTDEQISKMSSDEYKRQVKGKIQIFAINHIKKLQHSHSKTRELVLDGFSPAKYLVSPFLS